MKVVKSRKGLPRTKTTIILPENVTWIKQPNVVTLMSYDYQTIQLRALMAVMEKLQFLIEGSLQGKDITSQLNLFQDFDGDRLLLSIPLQDFGVSPNNYSILKDCLKKLATIPVEVDSVDPVTGKECWYIGGLLEAYLPKRYERNVKIRIQKDVAKMLVNVDRGFTKFIKEIAYKADSKYTVRIYMLISSWKERGGFTITLKNFRHWLKLEKKYKEYKDLYKRVIRPTYEDLFEKADCWFELDEVYEGKSKEPVKLNFKVVKGRTSEEDEKLLSKYKESLSAILSAHLGLNQEQIREVLKLLTTGNYTAIVRKVGYLKQYVLGKRIKNHQKYFVRSLVKEFDYTLIGEELNP